MGIALFEFLYAFQNVRQHPADLPGPAAGEQKHQIRVAGDGGIFFLCHDVNERMPRENRLEFCFAENLHFKGENHQYFGAYFCQYREPPFAPDPQVGRNVPDDFDL